MSKSTKTQTKAVPASKKHVKLDTVAALAAKQESGFTVNTLLSDVPRCAVQRAISQGVLKVLKDPVKTGHRGRPAQRLTLTIKGRSMAKRAVAA